MSTNVDIWNLTWSRPYIRYEKHHKFFWDKIKENVKGNVLDLACGSASCWKGSGCIVSGCDYSEVGIQEAKKNYPAGDFVVDTIPTNRYNEMFFGTVVISGYINYYEDLKPTVDMLKRIKYERIILTINIIDDYPSRHWDEKKIKLIFNELGKINTQFFERIGWLVIIDI